MDLGACRDDFVSGRRARGNNLEVTRSDRRTLRGTQPPCAGSVGLHSPRASKARVSGLIPVKAKATGAAWIACV